jgi:hypothetical protein
MKRSLKPWEWRAAKRSGLDKDWTLNTLHPTLQEINSPSGTDDACLHAIRLAFVERPKQCEPVARVFSGLAVVEQ